MVDAVVSDAGDRDFWYMLMALVAGVLIGIFGGVFLMIIRHNTYRDGQIDALNGIVKYELVVQPDSTRTWEKKGD